jgi:hypothetical protein
MPADRDLVAGVPEISRKRLLTDHVLSRLHGIDHHGRVQGRRRADIDDLHRFVAQQVAEIPVGRRNLMLAGKIADMIAARRNRRHFHFDPIDPLVGVHVQLGDKAAPNQAYFDFLHDRAPSVRIVGWVEFFTRPNN